SKRCKSLILMNVYQRYNGWEIEPFTFYIFRNGWLVGIVNPKGGELLINEDELIANLKNEK
ncbi:MAG: hypothetical protein QMD80_04115, partial [archaeon]|nr:hypothetical protein [archaeon]